MHESEPVPAFPQDAKKYGDRQSNVIEATNAFEKFSEMLKQKEVPTAEEIEAMIKGTQPEAELVIRDQKEFPPMNREMIKDNMEDIANSLEHLIMDGKIKNENRLPINEFAETFRNYADQIETEK